MDIKLEIDKEAIEKRLVDSIANSAIGEQVEKAIDKILKSNVGSGWDSKPLIEHAVMEAIKLQIYNMARELVEDKKESIKKQMSEKLTDEVLDKMTSAAWGIMESRLDKN